MGWATPRDGVLSHRGSLTGTGVRAMEGVLFCAASVAVLVGLGALVEAARPRRWGPGRQSDAPLRANASSAVILRRHL
jgi:hypothetical protein